MTYNKQTWVDGDKTRPLSAARLAHMETQYETAMADVAAAVGDPASPIGTQLNATIGQATATLVRGLNVTNLAGLKRWEAALGDAMFKPAVISVLGDSITWGVGSDGNAGGDNPSVFRETAWPVQLRRLFARRFGQEWTEDFIGITSGWAYTTVVGASSSPSLGPFGGYATGGSGGRTLTSGSGASVTLPAANVRPFTELDVYYWGSDSGASNPTEPTITIDGTPAHTSSGAAVTGNLRKITITGLSDAAHEIVLTGVASGRSVHLSHMVARRSAGVVVNRMGRSGATAVDGTGGTQTGAGKTRVLTANNSESNLLILALGGANDQPAQTSLETFVTAIQSQIDVSVAAGSCVLLLGSPPLGGTPSGAITEQDYRDAMRELASQEHVAFTDLRDLMGTHAQGDALGLFPAPTTVHPSRRGHGLIARSLFELLTQARMA